MTVSNSEYAKMVKSVSAPSPIVRNCVKAFIAGGVICAIGQGLTVLFEKAGLDKESGELLTPAALIVLTAILTAFGVFDRIAKHAGAGTFVPITGFANSVVSPALEFRSEGHVLGTGAQMFRLAGPVLVYGGTAAVIYGLFYFLFSR